MELRDILYMTQLSTQHRSDYLYYQELYPYCQYLQLKFFKTRTQVGEYRPYDWPQPAMLSNPKWIHAYKLGIFEDEEYYIGDRQPDTSTPPGEVSIQDDTISFALDMAPTVESKIEPVSLENTTNFEPNTTSTHVTKRTNRCRIDEMQNEDSDYCQWLSQLPTAECDDHRPVQIVHVTGSVQVINLDTYESDTPESIDQSREELPDAHESLPTDVYQDSALTDLINSSLQLEDTIVTETLAQLLAQHGHYSLARDMYEKLSQLNPEKSAFFASRIKELDQEE